MMHPDIYKEKGGIYEEVIFSRVGRVAVRCGGVCKKVRGRTNRRTESKTDCATKFWQYAKVKKYAKAFCLWLFLWYNVCN